MSGAKGVRLIKGKEPLRKLIVCAVEYEANPLYHDRRGRVVTQLGKLRSGWMPSNAVFDNKTTVLNPKLDVAVTFSNSTISLQLSREDTAAEIEQQEIAPFAEETAAVISLIVDEFEVNSFVRLGYQERFHFPCESLEETDDWSRKLGFMTVSPRLTDAFAAEVVNCSGSVTLRAEECRYGISIRQLERFGTIPVGGTGEIAIRESRAKHLKRDELLRYLKAKRDGQKNPAYFVSIDVDAYLWDELDTDFRVVDFVANHSTKNLDVLHQALSDE